jgi:hypothetical protein
MSRALLLQTVVERLRALGLHATVGDGVEVWFGLGVQHSAMFDCEDEYWAGHLMDANDDVQFDVLLTPWVSARSSDVDTIAQGSRHRRRRGCAAASTASTTIPAGWTWTAGAASGAA